MLSDVNTVMVELKLNREVIQQRLFSCALEGCRHPDVSKGLYSFVLTKKISHWFKGFVLSNTVKEILPVTTTGTRSKTANNSSLMLNGSFTSECCCVTANWFVLL